MGFNFAGGSSSGGSGMFGQGSNTNQNNSTPSTTAPSNPFGAPAATQSPFGGTTSQPASSGGIFGSLSASSQKPLSFGSTQAPGASAPSIFGGGTGNAGISQAGSVSGGGTNATKAPSIFTGGFSFAKKLDEKESSTTNKAQAPQQPNPFGGSTTLGQSSFGSMAASSAPIGLTTPVTTKPGGLFNFSNSTTPAGPPPAGNNAGAKAAETGFPSSQKPTNSTAQSPGFFGASNAGGSGSNMFGAKPTTPTSGPNMFAALNTPATSEAPKMFPTPATSSQSDPPPTAYQKFMSMSAAPSQTPSPFANFGKPSTTSTPASQSSSGPTTSAQGPGLKTLFPPKTTETAPTSGAATSAPVPSLFPLKATGATPASTATTSAPVPGASNLFPPKATEATPASSATTSAPVPSLFPPKTTEATPVSGATTSTPVSISFPPKFAEATVGVAANVTVGTGLGASTTGPAPQLSRLKNKTMDEIITRWATDLSNYQKEFQVQAAKAAAWDRLLVENGEKIQKLYSTTFEAEKASAEVEKQLASVEGQQDELTAWLDHYEQEVDQMFAKQVGPGESLQGPDQDRERTYKLAEKLGDRLDEMGKDLTHMIEEINNASAALTKTNKPDDPLSQIVRVLNGHLSQLQWIDQNATVLREKVDKARKEGKNLSTNGHGGENDAVDDFYRSYMGRR